MGRLFLKDDRKRKANVNTYSNVEATSVRWLWYPYISYGKLTLLQGDPGEGKSTFIIRVAAALTKGEALPGCCKPDEPVTVIYQCSEDGLSDTVKPRLMEAGADCSRVVYIVEEEIPLTLDDERIEDAIAQTGAKLMIIDPIQAFMGPDADWNNAIKIRHMLRNLSSTAQKYNCAVVMVGHLNKMTGGKNLYRGLGSIDIAAIARSVLMISRDKEEPSKRYMYPMIKEHIGWELVGIYADEGISGTSLQHRDDFNRMMEDCRAGKIDLIVTKSVSRFARNIVDCIAKQRELANLPSPVGVYFETEHIYSLDGTSEMMMAVLAAAAQEESHTKSEIMNISIEQRFSRGIFLVPELLGYDKDEDGNLVINEEEAETVKLCYYLFLNGFPSAEIAEILEELGRKTKLGRTKWTSGSVAAVLKNERHCGDVLSRKTYTPNYLDHKVKKNRHDRNQYKQSNHHEGIVSHEIFEAAQKLLAVHKYRKCGYPLPELRVVDGGALRGYVSVNRTWTGFTGEDYKKASESAYSDLGQVPSAKTEHSGYKTHFDLSGYQIARAQFFSTRQDPAMTISANRLTFNTACLKKFENVEYVELLFNSIEKCIAIRPCSAESVNAIRWGTVKEGRWTVLPKSCAGFATPLYNFMGWNDQYRYRFRGEYHKQDDEQILFFDLVQPEVIATVSKQEITAASSDFEDQKCLEDRTDLPDESAEIEKSAGNKDKRVTRIMYPCAWADSFGDDAERDNFLVLQRIPYYGAWDILRPARTVDGLQILNNHVLEDLMDEAKYMIEKMRCTG